MLSSQTAVVVERAQQQLLEGMMLCGSAGGIHMDKQMHLGPSLALRLTGSAWLMSLTTKISYLSPHDILK